MILHIIYIYIYIYVIYIYIYSMAKWKIHKVTYEHVGWQTF